MRLALLLSGFVLIASGAAEAGPFGAGRSEGRPTVKAKTAKPAKKAKKAKKAKPVVVEADDEEIDLDDDEPVVVARKEPKVGARKPKQQQAKVKPAKVKPAKLVEDEAPTITLDEPKITIEGEAEDDTEPTTDAEPTETAALDDDGEALIDAPIAVSRKAATRQPRKTRFYFRAGFQKQQTRLGETQFQIVTDLPIETGGLGADSGVVMEQNDLPVGAIVGVVLPVLNRKLSVEAILGIPRPTKLKATGALATESLAPTFQGMPTGIPALGSDIGEVTFAPPVVTGVYRITSFGPVTPIAGAGIMVLMTRGAKITNSVLNEAGDPKLKITPAPGLVLQTGLDIQLWNRVAARIDVKYVLGMRVNATVEDIAVTPTALPQLGSIDVGDAQTSAKVAPLIVQAGIGVDF